MLQRLAYESDWYPVKIRKNGMGGEYSEKQVDYVLKRIKRAKIEGQKAKLREMDKKNKIGVW
jgi:hypothetical protein